MNKTENKLVPELRFPKFSENWFVISVSDICDVYRGGTFSKADIDENGLESCIHYGELFTKYNEVISVVYSKTNKINGFKSQAGDILMPSSDVTPYGLAKASAIMLNNVILGGDMNILRPREEFNAIFLSYLLNNSQREIIKLVSGTTVKHIYPSQIITCQLPVVNNKSEQQKIANCLSSLDEVITSHNDKLEALKNHKKGLLQNLFPHEGETVPKFRFPEFVNDGDWKLITLGKLAENLDSKRIPITSNQREKGSIPYYGASGIIDYVKDHIFNETLLCISEDGANLIDRNYPIAFTIKDKTWVNNHAHVLKFQNYDTHVLVEKYINSINIQNFLTGAAQPKLNRGKLDIIPIPLPQNQKEQQKIAECLSSIDDLISSQTYKIEQLKDHKKGLMQRLFPKVKN